MGLIKEINCPLDHDDTAELTYFFDVIDQFLNILSEQNLNPSQNTLTLIARSAESCIAKALYNHKEQLKAHDIHLKVIFTRLTASQDLNNWLLPDQSPCTKPEQSIRWAKQNNLSDAHEQLTLGSVCSWSGESMRRDVNARFGFYMFDKSCKTSAIRAQRSFKALWKLSQTIPQAHFKRARFTHKPEFLNLEKGTANLSSKTSEILAPEYTRH